MRGISFCRSGESLTINDFFVILPTMNKQNNSAEQIIDHFGGQSSLANLLNRRQSTVQHWVNTGRIPSQWHKPLLKLAREKGISLEPNDFVVKETPVIAACERQTRGLAGRSGRC